MLLKKNLPNFLLFCGQDRMFNKGQSENQWVDLIWTECCFCDFQF